LLIYASGGVVAHPPVDPRSFLPLTPLAFQVLLALADTERHGYGIILEVGSRTDGLITLRTGTLYTLLQRLLEDALIENTSGPGGVQGTPPIKRAGVQGAPVIKNDPRRKYYGLTPLGRQVLAAEARRLESVLSDARRKHVIKRA